MRFLLWMLPLAAVGLIPPGMAFAGENAALQACLASSSYLDHAETVDLCDAASRVEGLDSKILAKVNLQIGEAFYYAQRPGLAIPYLDEAIKLDPSADQAYRRRGWSYLRQDKISQAMKDFTEFLALKPDDPDAQSAIANTRYATGRSCAAAVSDYERILEQSPGHYLTRYNLAEMYRCLDGHSVRQLEQLSQIIAAGRDAVAKVAYFGRSGRADLDFYANVRLSRAEILLGLDRYEDVRPDLDWLTQAYPENPVAFSFRSEVRIETGDILRGLEDAEAALADFPYYADAQYLKLKALARLRRHDEAVQFASSVLSSGYQSARTPDIHFMRGVAYKHLA